MASSSRRISTCRTPSTARLRLDSSARSWPTFIPLTTSGVSPPASTGRRLREPSSCLLRSQARRCLKEFHE